MTQIRRLRSSTMMDGQLKDLRLRLASILRSVCPPSMIDEIDDLLQVATLRLCDRIEREGIEDLRSSYLWKAAHSVLVDEIRRARRRREVDLSDTLEGPAEDDPLLQTQQLETGRALQQCLTRLIPPRRRAVTAYLLGHTVPEIAKMLDWKLKKAESLVYRGLKQLRECMTSKGIKP